jgi:hypothetical protein
MSADRFESIPTAAVESIDTRVPAGLVGRRAPEDGLSTVDSGPSVHCGARQIGHSRAGQRAED